MPTQGHNAGPEPGGTECEVLTGPGGPEREPARGAALRGLWQRQSVRAREVTAAATVAVLTLGGTVAYAATSSGSGDGASPVASGSASASPGPGGPGGRHGMRFGLGEGGMHGEATVKDPAPTSGSYGPGSAAPSRRSTATRSPSRARTAPSGRGPSARTAPAITTGRKSSGTGGLKEGETVCLVGTRSDDGTRTASRVLSGTWEDWKRDWDGKKDRGPGDWRGRFPGPRHWDRQAPGPFGESFQERDGGLISPDQTDQARFPAG